MLMSEALEVFVNSLVGAKSPETVTWYRKRLTPLVEFLGDMDVGAVTVNDLRRWRVTLAERKTLYENHPSGRSAVEGKLSPHTLHGYVRAARRFFAWLEEEELVEKNPARRLELPKLPTGGPKGIEHEDLKKMLAAAKESGPRDYALCWFFYSTGARVAGVVNLKLDDLKLDQAKAYVREKGAKTRVVPLVPHAVAAMRAWLAERPATDADQVFIGQRGPLHESGVYQILERLAERAGVEDDWNPHQWRHRRLRDLQAAGVSLGVVSQIAGHSSVEVTSGIYGVLPEAELLRACQIPLPFSPNDV